MFGPDILVAPIFNAENEVTYYVPKGRWVGLLDKKERIGPAWFTETHDFSSLPVLIREGSAIVLAKESKTPEYDLMKGGFEIVVNPNGGENASEVVAKIPQGKSVVTVHAKVREGKAWAVDQRGGLKAGSLLIL